MNSSMKKVLNNSLFFSIGIVASKAIGFVMLPIYTHYLSGEEYGIATTITAFVSTFSIVLMLSLRSALMRFYNEYSEQEVRKTFVGSIFITIIVNGIVIIVLLLINKDFINRVFFKGIDFFPQILMGIFALFFDSLYFFYQSVLQARQEGEAYSLNSILYLLTNAIFNFIFIVLLKMHENGMILGLFASNTIFAFYGLMQMYRRNIIKFRFNRKIAVRAIRYSLPMIPHDLANTIGNYISKVILNVNISYAASGLYTISTQISSVMNLVQSAVNLAFRPWFNDQMKEGIQGRKNIRQFSIVTFSIYSFVSIGIAYFSQEIIYILVSEEYYSAWKPVPLLLLALVISFIYYIHVLSIMYNLKASKYVAICSLTGCFVNILLSYLLVNRFNVFGIAIAKLASQIILATVTVIFSKSVEKVDFGLPTMIKQIIIVCFMMYLGLFLSYHFNICGINLINILYKIVLLFISGVIILGKYRKNILIQIKEVMYMKLKNRK